RKRRSHHQRGTPMPAPSAANRRVLIAQDDPTTPPSESPPPQDEAGPAVLVVDDEQQVRRVLELALSREGLTVWSAPGGKEAVELYARHRERIGVVLLDVQMPEMDGPCTLGALLQLNPHVRAVFISGHTGKYDSEQLLAMGAA